MAKQKMKDFFPSSRRELTLSRYELLATAGGEKRSKLTVEMPDLAAHDFKGMPQWISNPFQEMLKTGSATSRTALDAFCEGMTMEIFATEKNKRRTLMSTGTYLTSFALVTTGEADKRKISLTFAMYVPANIELHQWAWDPIHKTFFAQFEYSQTEMDFDGADDEKVQCENCDKEFPESQMKTTEDDASLCPECWKAAVEDSPKPDDQDDDPDSAAAVAARARKPFNARAIQSAAN